MNFATTIIKWYTVNKRDLPWRNTNNPYLIWLSEIILQQTRVDQGMPYYIKFTENFPTLLDLAAADEKKVLKLWQGLGYYSRARNLHTTAKYIASQFKGVFPDNYNEIIKLKGIGQYTAGAIASFAFNEPQPVVDGNVFRVLSRYFGIDKPIDSTIGKNYFYALAKELLDKKKPALFNQAIMEFGAMQCTPKNPLCATCPLNNSCIALEKKLVHLLPVKAKKTKVSHRFFYYLVIEKGSKLYIKQRVDTDIWKGLYDFPLIEAPAELSINNLTEAKVLTEIFGNSSYVLKSVSETYKHILSHQRIFARFLSFSYTDKKTPFSTVNTLKKPLKNSISNEVKFHFTGCELIFKSALKNYAIPRLIERYIQAQKAI